MQCYFCGTEMVHREDEDEEITDNEDFDFSVTLDCPDCEALAVVYRSKEIPDG